MKDNLEIFKENGWGWSLWNFRGSFGILDSGRKDVEYESYKGHKLDRKMLSLLQNY
jgi:endoglucanase